MTKKDFNDEDGVWRTIGGRKIFIRKGQNLADAMIESGKFKGQKNKPGTRESYRKEIDKIEDERKEAKSEEQRLKRETDSLANAYSNNRYGYGTDYWGKHWNDARKMTNEQTKEVANYDAMLDKEGQKESNERQKAFDKEHGKADKLREEYRNNKYYNKDDDDFIKEAKLLVARDKGKLSEEELFNEQSKMYGKDPKAEKERVAKNFDRLGIEKPDFLKKTEDKSTSTTQDPYDDLESEESQRLQSIQSRYDDYLQQTEGRGASYGEIAYVDNLRGKDLDDFEKELDEFEEKKSTNETMNNAIREKATKKKEVEQDLPKHTEIKEQGTSNRKEVSENIQAHILDYYDSPEDFIEQMDVFDYLPNNWKRGEEIAKGGSYLIYNSDMADFLNELKINPKGKTFSEDKAFDMYTSLVGRESAKLYDRLKKNAYKQYKKEHPLSNMSFEDYKNMKKQ